MSPITDWQLGATSLDEQRCRFLVWAPHSDTVDVHIVAPQEQWVSLTPGVRGYHHTVAAGVPPGSLYYYRLNGRYERPDPASRLQPHDVHGPSQVVDLTFAWDDGAWHGLPWSHYVLYELHVGTYTPAGTFDALIPHLDALRELGVTALALMPVAQFPGQRNWGYDGVYPFAVQQSYGGPQGFQRLVNACHQRRLAVVLDVVYNHLGPEGNYLREFGPYFTERYTTPWGQALNVDGPYSDEVRRLFIENALAWVRDFHIDALRLDAVHAIVDQSAQPFLQEVTQAVHRQAERLHRQVYVIAESNLNDPRILHPLVVGGYGLDAQWSDDFHHALHVLLTGEHNGYYQDFGGLHAFARAWREGFVYAGEVSPSRQRRHGTSSRHIPAAQFVVCTQNHDQVGNRMRGERLSQLVSFAHLKLAAVALLLSPYIPLLFMGEEYGETAPFPYFISHLDPHLVAAVQRGRGEEFADFRWLGEPLDPQAETTFVQARLDHTLRHVEPHRTLYAFYTELLRLRTTLPALAQLSKDHMDVLVDDHAQVLLVRRWCPTQDSILLLHFGPTPRRVTLPWPPGTWRKRLDSMEVQWQGAGSRLPERLTSGGEVALALSPVAGVLFIRQEVGSRC